MRLLGSVLSVFAPFVLAACSASNTGNARCMDPLTIPRGVTPMGGSASPGSAAGSAPAPRVRIVLAPKPTPSPHVDVTITVGSDVKADVTHWTMSHALAASIGASVTAKDGSGAITTSIDNAGDMTHVVLARAPAGELEVTYAVAAAAPAFPNPPAVTVDPDRFEGAGDALLLLPDAMEKEPTPTLLRIDTHAIGAEQYIEGASSFGVGAERTIEARARELRYGEYVAGNMGKAKFEAPEGHDEAAWIGYTAFDPRPAAADMAGFRTAVRQVLKAGDSLPATILFLTDSRPVGAFVVARRARSVLVRVGLGEIWSGPVRIASASALLHEWVGDRLWVGPSDAAHEAEAYWFSEGVVRNVARNLLFKFGLITPAEDQEEIEGLEALAVTSPFAGLDNVTLAKRAHEPGVTPLLVARGALYAARVDALLQKRKGAKRTVEDVLASLYARANTEKGPLPAAAWIEALTPDLGDGEKQAFTDAIDRGKPVDLPEGTLGPCFARVTKTFGAFDLGFDEDKTVAAMDHALVGLEPQGPAARAGILEGDVLVSVKANHGRADVPAVITVTRAGESKAFRYAPAGATAKGQGWERRKDVSDDACTK